MAGDAHLHAARLLEEAFVFAATVGAMVLSTFVFDTLDVGTRLGSYIVQELLGAQSGRVAVEGWSRRAAEGDADESSAVPHYSAILAPFRGWNRPEERGNEWNWAEPRMSATTRQPWENSVPSPA